MSWMTDKQDGETLDIKRLQDRKHHNVPKRDDVFQQNATGEELKDERKIF